MGERPVASTSATSPRRSQYRQSAPLGDLFDGGGIRMLGAQEWEDRQHNSNGWEDRQCHERMMCLHSA
jgi:hypothetical protein